MTGISKLSIVQQGTNVVLSWTPGQPPYQLQKSIGWASVVRNGDETIATGNWKPVGNATMAETKTLPIEYEPNSNSIAFDNPYAPGPRYFRLQEAVPLADADLSDPNKTKWIWAVPDLQ